LTLVGALLIVAANPNIPLNWGWNTIEHIPDPVPSHNYARDGAIAMAQSGPWLALATPSDGMVVVSTRSRVPVSSMSEGVLDVTAGLNEGSFFSLDSSYGVTLTRRDGWRWGNAAWLMPATAPFWKSGRPFVPSDVLFTDLDEKGLLIAAQGVGIARNRFSSFGGGLQRSRDWEQSDKFSSFDLSQIVGTAKGYWLTLGSGGIRFADRGSLNEVPQRAANTAAVRQLSAAKSGAWATAVDENDNAWLFEERNNWTGPWFGKGVENLNSSSNITAARLSGGNLWLGGTSGLFRYGMARHQMQAILKDTGVEELEVAGDGILATASSGLYYAGPSGAVSQLDDVRPRGLRLSPSGDIAAYWSEDKKTGEPLVRAITSLASARTPFLLRVKGWHAGDTPDIRGILQSAGATLFATSLGCFLYEPSMASYEDCSSAVSHHPSQHKLSLKSFSSISQEDGAILASADGRSLVFGGDAWTVVDPTGETEIRRFTAVSGQVYGLSTQGQIVRFASNGKPDLRLGSAASSLGSGSGPFRGDLAGDSNSWRLLVVVQSRLLEYRSDSAKWSETATPFEPKQAVLFGDGAALVSPQGSLYLSPSSGELFGSGSLAFAPTQASALALGQDASIFLGGPAGRIARYYFNSASWKNLPALPSQAGSIMQLQDQADGLWVRTSSGAVHRFFNGKWTAEPVEPAWTPRTGGGRTIDSGGLQWRLGDSGVSVTSGQTAIAWTQTGTGWRLNCDILLQVNRTGTSSLTLETGVGAWAWEAATGRSKPVALPVPAQLSIATPAIRVSLSGGQIHLAAFDSGPALENGQFFFDVSSDIRGYRGALYSVVVGRALIRRVGSAPGRVDGAWPLPQSSGVSRSLVPGTSGIRLAEPERVYELTEGPQSSAWRLVQSQTESVSSGLFTWRRTFAGSWYVTYEGDGRSWNVNRWWSRGRFAWDDYLAAAAVDGQRLAFATPLGVVIRRVAGGLETLIQSQRFASSAMARKGAQIIGTLFDGVFLLRIGAQGKPELVPASPGMNQSVSVGFGATGHERLGRVFTFREEWSATGSRGAALYSRVPSIPSSSLIHAGRFVFDAPSAVALVSGPRWMIATGCGSAVGCLVASFVDDDGTLFMTAISSMQAKIVAFGASGDGHVFALAGGPRTFRVDVGRVLEVPPAQTGDAFEAGYATRLNVAKLAWSKIPVKVWDRRPRLASDPSGFPLLRFGTNGMAFSFDILTTLAMDVRSGELAIGTEGGLFMCQGRAQESAVFELARACEFTYRAVQDRRQEFLVGFQRVRVDRDGKLWARLDPGTFWRRDGTWVRDDSGGPFTSTNVNSLGVRFLPGGIKIAESSFNESNNAWWLGRRTFQQIIDSSYDDSTGILWLCDRASGVFAIKLDRFSGPSK